jgi:hypothetical protein
MKATVAVLLALTLGHAAQPAAASALADRVVREAYANGRLANLWSLGRDSTLRIVDPRLIREVLQLRPPPPKSAGLLIIGGVFHAPLNLELIRTAGSVAFEDCVFEAPVRLGGARIDGQLVFKACKLRAGGRSLAMPGAEIVNDLIMTGTSVSGSADLSSLRVMGGARLDSTNFSGPVSTLLLSGSQFGASLNAQDAAFAGKVDLSSCRVGEEVLLNRSRFTNPLAALNFNRLDVGGRLDFHSAVFAGATRFTFASVGGTILGDQARFLRSDTPTMFNNLSAKGRVRFVGTYVGNALWLTASDLNSLLIRGLQSPTGTPPEVDLSYARIAGDIEVGNATLGRLAWNSCIANRLQLSRVSAGPVVDARDAKIGVLGLTEVRFSGGRDSVRLDGMRFERLRVAEGGGWKHAVRVFDSAAFAPNVYLEAERAWRAEGELDWADAAYVAMRQRERSERWGRWWLCVPWMLDFVVLDLLTEYGRGVWRVSIPCVVIVCGGAWVFRRKSFVEPRAGGSEYIGFSPLWFSIGIFLPGVRLISREEWRPRGSCGWRVTYAEALSIAGWILVPLGLAGMLGLIR